LNPLIELSKLKPKGNLKELRTGIDGRNPSKVNIDLEGEVIDGL
jgi:hypothetical protein